MDRAGSGSCPRPGFVITSVEPSGSATVVLVDLYGRSQIELSPYCVGGSLVTTAWCVLRLRMEETPTDMEGSF
jgi:hypothetical protein